LGRLREIQEVRDDFTERLGFLPDAMEMWMIGRGQRVQVQQPRISVNRRETISKFVGNAGGQLSDLREALLQSELLFHFDNRREVREQADGAMGLSLRVRQGRDADAHVGLGGAGCVDLDGAPGDRLSPDETLVDHFCQRLGEHLPEWLGNRRVISVQQPPPRRVEDAKPSVAPYHQQARGEALDDLAAQAL
jgi:hypothetical protein